MPQPKTHSIKRAGSSEKPERTRLEKITTLSVAAASVIVTGLIGYFGASIQQSIAKQTTAKDYVSLAIEILKFEPKKDSSSDPLRDWAVDVLRLDSPVPISKEALTELRKNRLVYDQAVELQIIERLIKRGAQIIIPDTAVPGASPKPTGE